MKKVLFAVALVMGLGRSVAFATVSYTHLDVYKRQVLMYKRCVKTCANYVTTMT